MSLSGNTRAPHSLSELASSPARTAKPDQTRADLQAAKLCIDCKRPSETQRCIKCSRRVEANTDRYRGRGRFGAPSISVLDLADMRYAARAVMSAHHQHGELEKARASTTRSRQKLIELEMLSQVSHAKRFLEEIERRHKVLPPERIDPTLEAEVAP